MSKTSSPAIEPKKTPFIVLSSDAPTADAIPGYVFITTVWSAQSISKTVSDIDFGDWLMMEGKVDQETYDTKQVEAKEMLGVR